MSCSYRVVIDLSSWPWREAHLRTAGEPVSESPGRDELSLALRFLVLLPAHAAEIRFGALEARSILSTSGFAPLACMCITVFIHLEMAPAQC